MSWLDNAAEQQCDTWRSQGLERTPAIFSTGQTPVATIDSHEYVLFSSSNYLGLAEHPAVTEAASDALNQFGAGSGGVDFVEASLQLRLAYEHFIKPPKFINPSFAQQRHERIHFGGKSGFEHKRPA